MKRLITALMFSLFVGVGVCAQTIQGAFEAKWKAAMPAPTTDAYAKKMIKILRTQDKVRDWLIVIPDKSAAEVTIRNAKGTALLDPNVILDTDTGALVVRPPVKYDSTYLVDVRLVREGKRTTKPIRFKAKDVTKVQFMLPGQFPPHKQAPRRRDAGA